jgi:hypothetical protein
MKLKIRTETLNNKQTNNYPHTAVTESRSISTRYAEGCVGEVSEIALGTCNC